MSMELGLLFGGFLCGAAVLLIYALAESALREWYDRKERD